MNEHGFKCNNMPDDLGKLVFECDDSQTMYDTSKAKRRAMLRSPASYVLLSILAFMVGWFVYSLVATSIADGFLLALIEHISGFILLVVAGVILVLSAFGLWGKFMRFAFKKNLVRARGSDGARMRALKKDLDESDARKPTRNALSVYENYIVVVKGGKPTAYVRKKIVGLRIRSYGAGKKAEFMSYLGERMYFVVSQADARELRRIFDDIYVKPKKYKVARERRAKKLRDRSEPKQKRTRVKPTWHSERSVGASVGLTLFMLAPMGIGAAVVALHYCVNAQIPMFLGVFFMIGGVVGLLTVYSYIPIIHDFFIPFAFGAMLTVSPLGLLGAIFSDQGITFSLAEIFGKFTALNAGFVFLTLIGAVILLYSFYALYKYIRYGVDE